MFYLEIFAILITFVNIYVALKWDKIEAIPQNIRKMRFLRIALVIIAIAVDALAYFAGYSTAVWLVGMAALSFPFVIKKRNDNA